MSEPRTVRRAAHLHLRPYRPGWGAAPLHLLSTHRRPGCVPCARQPTHSSAGTRRSSRHLAARGTTAPTMSGGKPRSGAAATREGGGPDRQRAGSSVPQPPARTRPQYSAGTVSRTQDERLLHTEGVRPSPDPEPKDYLRRGWIKRRKRPGADTGSSRSVRSRVLLYFAAVQQPTTEVRITVCRRACPTAWPAGRRFRHSHPDTL